MTTVTVADHELERALELRRAQLWRWMEEAARGGMRHPGEGLASVPPEDRASVLLRGGIGVAAWCGVPEADYLHVREEFARKFHLLPLFQIAEQWDTPDEARRIVAEKIWELLPERLAATLSAEPAASTD